MDVTHSLQSGKNATDQSAAAKPKGLWTTILTITPIALTVLATIFAGLSTGENTQSMYYRCLAGQQQSKAGDQWAYFQAKKIRATSLELEIDLLQSLTHADHCDPAQMDAALARMLELLEKSANEDTTLKQELDNAVNRISNARARLARLLNDEATRSNLAYLNSVALPKPRLQALSNEETQKKIEEVVALIRGRKPESQTDPVVATLKATDIEAATGITEEDADRFDRACEPVRKVLKELHAIVGEVAGALISVRKHVVDRSDQRDPLVQSMAWCDGLSTSFKITERDFDDRRYQEESFFNGRVAESYEVEVRHSSYQSNRHRERSRLFFYGMLVAQAGVTLASLALARQQHNLLWLLFAVAAGITALGFCGYVYVSF